jgi:hypothetical protein
MASRQFQQFQFSLERGVVKLFATVVTSTSGTIASQDAMGMTIAKVGSEAGRYKLTLADAYQRVLACNAVVIGAADAAYATANGVNSILRNVAVSGAAPALEVQFTRTDTGADAELADGASRWRPTSGARSRRASSSRPRASCSSPRRASTSSIAP